MLAASSWTCFPSPPLKPGRFRLSTICKLGNLPRATQPGKEERDLGLEMPTVQRWEVNGSHTTNYPQSSTLHLPVSHRPFLGASSSSGHWLTDTCPPRCLNELLCNSSVERWLESSMHQLMQCGAQEKSQTLSIQTWPSPRKQGGDGRRHCKHQQKTTLYNSTLYKSGYTFPCWPNISARLGFRRGKVQSGILPSGPDWSKLWPGWKVLDSGGEGQRQSLLYSKPKGSLYKNKSSYFQ